MADLNLKDKGGIVKYGGGILRLSECSDAGVLTGSDFTDLGYIEVTDFKDDRAEEKTFDETGAIVKRNYGDRDILFEATLMQTNVEVLDFIMAAENKYYTLYYKATKTGDINSKTQELFAGICQIKPSIRIQSGQKRLPISIQMLPNEAAINITTPATLFESVKTDTVAIAANAYYKIVEN